ncbi:hypothetical protein EVAR_29534_1 [Eumeta japonica]|uniref:Uncharacterized protein n=1 Tax=Eumeta variegata TaxID=151549 RepID=A0A4C1WFJ9_EUMVA|nr:hypothetical protein EVAR_29534_1 [Eumeta japonica]
MENGQSREHFNQGVFSMKDFNCFASSPCPGSTAVRRQTAELRALRESVSFAAIIHVDRLIESVVERYRRRASHSGRARRSFPRAEGVMQPHTDRFNRASDTYRVGRRKTTRTVSENVASVIAFVPLAIGVSAQRSNRSPSVSLMGRNRSRVLFHISRANGDRP